MLYYLFDWLEGVFHIPGIGVFQYITFRAAMAVICSLLITIVFGKRLIQYLRKKQVGESIRNLGLEGQMEKQGTPTMGGVIIIAAILIPTFLFAKLNNIYVILMIVTTIWLGTLGFIDDYIKVFKKDKKGLAGKFKILGQIVLGIIVGLTILYHPDITVRKKVIEKRAIVQTVVSATESEKVFFQPPVKSIKTTIPFVKNNEFDYAKLISWMGSYSNYWVWLIYVLVVIFIITSVSNAANLTDGIDGLATGTSAIVGGSLAVLAWLSGNMVFANYLNIMYLPNIGELTVFIAAFIGATIGFLWYNTYPAQVFMGDTGSLALGGIIAVFAILIRKELLIPIMCGVFLVENFSVVLQVSYFKYTKKRFGEGKRIFLMSPLHHHFQKKGYAEPKIVQRFFIVGIILAVVSIITLKLR